MEPKIYRCTLEVRGYELDSFGHVNNSVYLNYLEHARWKMLNQEGITLEQITREKLWPVIAAIEIKYIKPAFMGDTLEVRTQIVEYSKARFQFDQQIYKLSEHREMLVASAKVHSVVVNETGRPVEVPSYYAKFWS
jgi:acyl-CoA thioester hydrolase